MTLTVRADPVPLRVEDDGTVRVGNTRVLLELVIRAFQDEAAPAEIVGRYPSLELADVYAVVTYYLRHRDEVDEYLRQQEQQAAEIRRKIEANQRPGPTREELLRRRDQGQRDKTARLLAEMQRNSVPLPPGCPSTTELLREDRDR